MFTIAPRSFHSSGTVWLIAVAARRMQLNVPIRLMLMTLLKWSRLKAESYEPSLPIVRVAQPIPAEFTKTRSGPISFAARAVALRTILLIDHLPPVHARLPKLFAFPGFVELKVFATLDGDEADDVPKL